MQVLTKSVMESDAHVRAQGLDSLLMEAPEDHDLAQGPPAENTSGKLSEIKETFWARSLRTLNNNY